MTKISYSTLHGEGDKKLSQILPKNNRDEIYKLSSVVTSEYTDRRKYLFKN